MDGIHDMGGMQGFGPVKSNDDTGGYHADWEGLVHSAFIATLGSGVHNIDEFRHSIERMKPDHYLNAAYYDRWLIGVSTLAVEKGVISPEELRDRTAAISAGEATVPDRRDPDRIKELIDGVIEQYTSRQEQEQGPKFELGDEVKVRNMHPDGHTRCPGYVRNARGIVKEYRGTHTLPDAHAHGNESVEAVYNVAFNLEELWDEDGERGAGDSNDIIRIELWESYLTEVNK